MKDAFVIGDIHGEFNRVQEMLKHWNSDTQQLIFLGDLIDRGPDSYKIVSLTKELKEKYGAIVLKGNHEEMLLSWLEMPSFNMDLYYPNGGRETIHSFFNNVPITFTNLPSHIADLMKEKFVSEIEFLKSLPCYFEKDKHVFVHAGVNPYIDDWKNSRESDFCWIREQFHYSKNETGKIFFFGHTPTINLNTNDSFDVWISSCQTKIGIDGGAVFGGLLHGVSINSDNTYTVHSIDKNLNYYTKNIALQPSI